MLIKIKKQRKTPSPWGHTNVRNYQIMKWLKGVHPSFARHVFERNGLVQAVCMERGMSTDQLELPVCERCEKPGLWHDDDSCWCNPCGHKTPKEHTKTLYRYIAEDSIPGGMKKEDMDLLSNILMPTISREILGLIEEIEKMEPNNYREVEDETNIDTVQEWTGEDSGEGIQL